MKVIITGTSGFIGKRLFQMARTAYGSDATSFSSRPCQGSHIIYRDIPGFGLAPRELTLVEEAEVLVHAGAFTPKSGADANYIVGCNGNITFTEKLLSLPWHNLQKIVFLSTIDVYEDVDELITEATATRPATLYALSKLYGERMVTLDAAERDFRSQVLRIGHVYGPGEEKYAKVVPRAIQRIVAGQDIELWGEGTELRSYIYVDDVVRAILRAVELQHDPGVINIVGGHPISVRELLEKLIAISGCDTRIVKRKFSSATRNFVFDNSKMKRFLLEEETDFAVGLRAEFDHFKTLRDADP